MAKRRFAASLYASRATSSTLSMSVETGHRVDIIEATSNAEALGKGYNILREALPPDAGWERYDVRIMEII